MIRALAIALPLLSLIAACAPEPAKRRATPPPIPAYAKPWRFSQAGEQATLTYGDGGPMLLACAEGSNRVEIRAPDGPTGERTRRVTLIAGQGPQRIELAIPFDHSAAHAPPAWSRTFNIHDLLIEAFGWSNSLRIDTRDFPSNRSKESVSAAWHFLLTCQDAPIDALAVGQPQPASLYALLKNLDPARASADARAALTHGDRRLAAVYGYAPTTPGVDDERLIGKAGYRLIDPPSEVSFSAEHRALKTQAREYARAYNATIVAGR